jgi:hypothetical protein
MAEQEKTDTETVVEKVSRLSEVAEKAEKELLAAVEALLEEHAKVADQLEELEDLVDKFEKEHGPLEGGGNRIQAELMRDLGAAIGNILSATPADKDLRVRFQRMAELLERQHVPDEGENRTSLATPYEIETDAMLAR